MLHVTATQYHESVTVEFTLPAISIRYDVRVDMVALHDIQYSET